MKWVIFPVWHSSPPPLKLSPIKLDFQGIRGGFVTVSGDIFTISPNFSPLPVRSMLSCMKAQSKAWYKCKELQSTLTNTWALQLQLKDAARVNMYIWIDVTPLLLKSQRICVGPRVASGFYQIRKSCTFLGQNCYLFPNLIFGIIIVAILWFHLWNVW